jgi:hypothetical protein
LKKPTHEDWVNFVTTFVENLHPETYVGDVVPMPDDWRKTINQKDTYESIFEHLRSLCKSLQSGTQTVRDVVDNNLDAKT